jgi:serine/threonine protein kinase
LLVFCLSILIFLGLRQTFEDLLVHYDPHVVARARKRFGLEVIQCVNENNRELALRVYEDALNLPQTKTEVAFKISGYELNGNYNSALIICFRGTFTCLLKILTNREIERSLAFHAVVENDLASGSYSPFITKFELHTVHTTRATTAMIMPYYPSTLESWMFAKDGWNIVVNQMFSALSYIHSKGFVYMDMKPSNVCLNYDGNVVLIDLGSIVPVGISSSSTELYLPKDMHNPRSVGNNLHVASFDIDLWMLIVTVLEKASEIELTGSKLAPSRRDLVPDVVKYFINGEITFDAQLVECFQHLVSMQF